MEKNLILTSNSGNNCWYQVVEFKVKLRYLKKYFVHSNWQIIEFPAALS